MKSFASKIVLGVIALSVNTLAVRGAQPPVVKPVRVERPSEKPAMPKPEIKKEDIKRPAETSFSTNQSNAPRSESKVEKAKTDKMDRTRLIQAEAASKTRDQNKKQGEVQSATEARARLVSDPSKGAKPDVRSLEKSGTGAKEARSNFTFADVKSSADMRGKAGVDTAAKAGISAESKTGRPNESGVKAESPGASTEANKKGGPEAKAGDGRFSLVDAKSGKNGESLKSERNQVAGETKSAGGIGEKASTSGPEAALRESAAAKEKADLQSQEKAKRQAEDRTQKDKRTRDEATAKQVETKQEQRTTLTEAEAKRGGIEQQEKTSKAAKADADVRRDAKDRNENDRSKKTAEERNKNGTHGEERSSASSPDSGKTGQARNGKAEQRSAGDEKKQASEQDSSNGPQPRFTFEDMAKGRRAEDKSGPKKETEQPGAEKREAHVNTSAAAEKGNGAPQGSTSLASSAASSSSSRVHGDPARRLTYDPVDKSYSSPAGLIYEQIPKRAPDDDNRVKHVLKHTAPDASAKKTKHSEFDVVRNEQVIPLLDEAWNARKGMGNQQTNGNRNWVVDMGRIIGRGGETKIKIVVVDGTSRFVTAYPD